MEFIYTGMIIDKTRIYAEGYDYEGFYKELCGLVFMHAKPMLINANVKIDKSGGHGFRRELFVHLKLKVNEPSEVCRIRQVTAKEFHGNNLLQLADMICGAVAWSHRLDEAKQHVFRKLVAHRERNMLRWPE